MNYFKILQAIKPLIQSGKLTRIDEALSYLQSMGMKIDGILRQGVENMFKKIKARDPEFGNVVQKLPIDDAGIPFNPKTLKSTAEKRGIRGTSEADKDIAFIQEGIDDLNKVEREADLVSQGLVKGKNKEGVETLFEEVKVSPKEVKYGKPNYELIAEREGIDVELIKGKSVKEIIEIIAAVRDKADGGRVGFVDGGWADDLTGQGLSIYNSMTAGGHSDQTIQDTLTELGYWTPDGAATETVESIVNIGADTTQGGDNIPVGPTSSDFQTVLDTRQKRLQDPSKIASFIGNYIPQQRSVQDMLTSGVKDQRLTSGLPWGLSGLAAKMLPDKYYDMPLGDQAFIQSQMGYTDPQTNMANKDPFGINVRSMFGNYADFVTDEVSKLEEIVADQLRRGLTDTHQMKRLNYYKPLSMQRKNIQSDVGLINLAKQKEQEAAAAQAVTSLNELTSQASGGGGRGIASAGVASGRVDPAGMGGGSRQATSAGAQKTDRSDKGWGWREGGLATMFTRRR